jgi:circadian clock protein KaiB
MESIHLKLYVTGHTARSLMAIANLRQLCKSCFGDNYKLDIIDVLEKPETAEQDRILATPTLIKYMPPPIRRLIGDLSDQDLVLKLLDVNQLNNNSIQ